MNTYEGYDRSQPAPLELRQGRWSGASDNALDLRVFLLHGVDGIGLAVALEKAQKSDEMPA